MSIIFAAIIYCAPNDNSIAYQNCINWMVNCIIENDSEENCVENLPESFWPK